MASIGLYPVGPGAQIARNLGMGTPQDVLNTLAGLAQVIPGDTGAQLQSTIETVAALLAAAQAGINIPLIGNVAFPEVSVPPAGPAGTIDQVAGLEGSTTTTVLLSLLKTATLNGDGLAAALGILGDLTGIDTAALETLVADLPLNVPGTSATAESTIGDIIPGFPDLAVGGFVSSADKFAIIPTWGLGGTNFALASPTFLSDPTFAKTAILAIALRNTSRPGGGIAALLNPLSQTVGLNLSNVDGRGETSSETIDVGLVDVTLETTTGNVTVWDITAAYDLLSDAPSTVYSPLAWLNSGVGAVSPTYLIPANVTDFAAVLKDVTSGQINIDTLNTLLGTINSSIDMFHINVGEDGNLYVTYNSGNLPLLEPFQFVPRTISYLPGFDISTPVSSSFEDVLTQLVAQGYQDVNMTVDSEGVATFVRGFDAAGTQAKFWQNPVSWEMGLETPQTVFNSIISGLQQNLLDPEANEFEVFGNSEIGELVYRNAVSVAVAKFVSDALEQLRDTLNPVFNSAQDAFRPVAVALDKATVEVNKVIDDGLNEVTKLGIDASGPLLDANRTTNEITSTVNNSIREAIGLKPIDSPPAHESPEASSEQARVALTGDVTPDPVADIAPAVTNTAAAAPVVAKEEDDTPPAVVVVTDDSSVAEEPAPTVKKTAAQRAQDRIEKRIEKTERSLTRAEERAQKVADKLAKGDVTGAVRQVGDNVKNRADRLGKDVQNGLNKVRDAISGGPKKDTDKKPDSDNGGGSSSSGGSSSGE